MNQDFTNSQDIPNKSTIHLTDKQLRYIALRAEGKKRTEAVKLAGYGSTTMPAAIEKSDNLHRALTIAMEAKGLTTEKLAEKLANGVDAKKKYFSSYQGKVISEREIDDHETQIKYVRTALEVRGDLQEKSVEVNLGLIQIPPASKSINDWNNDDASTQK